MFAESNLRIGIGFFPDFKRFSHFDQSPTSCCTSTRISATPLILGSSDCNLSVCVPKASPSVVSFSVLQRIIGAQRTQSGPKPYDQQRLSFPADTIYQVPTSSQRPLMLHSSHHFWKPYRANKHTQAYLRLRWLPSISIRHFGPCLRTSPEAGGRITCCVLADLES